LSTFFCRRSERTVIRLSACDILPLPRGTKLPYNAGQDAQLKLKRIYQFKCLLARQGIYALT
ncbi:MAG: hypothetical protein CMH99_10745, partial [Oceanospirillaceae bacterium]|nr:hypothetical protein [Oceanospirillaceae bacterium]